MHACLPGCSVIRKLAEQRCQATHDCWLASSHTTCGKAVLAVGMLKLSPCLAFDHTLLRDWLRVVSGICLLALVAVRTAALQRNRTVGECCPAAGYVCIVDLGQPSGVWFASSTNNIWVISGLCVLRSSLRIAAAEMWSCYVCIVDLGQPYGFARSTNSYEVYLDCACCAVVSGLQLRRRGEWRQGIERLLLHLEHLWPLAAVLHWASGCEQII